MVERVNVLVRGIGDVGSAVAVILYRAGFTVALHDEPQPATSRRGMAFADAAFDGSATLDGLIAHRVDAVAELRTMMEGRAAIPVSTGPFPELCKTMAWSAIIDARMRKRAPPERQRGDAPLTIGLGPNFTAGDNIDIAIETSWGDRLGAVIECGATLPLAGEPQPLGGIARARFVYAQVAGRFQTSMCIGDRVEQDAVVASIAGTALCAPVSGVVRGLTHDGVSVALQTKVIEVDPRGDPVAAFGLGTRPRRIAEGVLRAMTNGLTQA
jgi:xanthine dehydrogenase accessory factor